MMLNSYTTTAGLGRIGITRVCCRTGVECGGTGSLPTARRHGPRSLRNPSGARLGASGTMDLDGSSLILFAVCETWRGNGLDSIPSGLALNGRSCECSEGSRRRPWVMSSSRLAAVVNTARRSWAGRNGTSVRRPPGINMFDTPATGVRPKLYRRIPFWLTRE
jgi:hypothetical protein